MHATLYSWSSCSFCARAKALLESHGVAVTEEILDGRRQELERLQKAFGARTMPLVLLNGEPIAGLDELQKRADSGELDE